MQELTEALAPQRGARFLGGVVGGILGGGGGAGGGIVVEEVKRVKSSSIAAFPCPKVNDKGLTGAWWWADKIALAVAVWATTETYKSAKKEYEIGKRYYKLAQDQWTHFYKNYRPLEEQELSEIWAEGIYTPDYAGEVQGHTYPMDSIFNNAEQYRDKLADKYCVCPNVDGFRKFDFVKSTIRGDTENFARRYAEKLAQEKNDIRWSRRIVAISRGRNLLSASLKFGREAAALFSEYSKAMGGLAGNAMQFSGYVRNRNSTEYNPVRQRINSRADVPDFYSGMDTIKAVDNVKEYESIARGGLDWGHAEANTPYMQSGFDPTYYVRAAPAV